MTKQWRGKAHMRRIRDRHCRGGSVAKQMRIKRYAKFGLGPNADAIIDRFLGHGRSIFGEPESVVGWFVPATTPGLEDRTIRQEIFVERLNQTFRPFDLKRSMRFGFRFFEDNEKILFGSAQAQERR